jgi:hypothetical protein
MLKCIIIIIIIGIQPLGRSGQRPELSQATGMALERCILGKFLGVVCHCFPPLKCIYMYFLIFFFTCSLSHLNMFWSILIIFGELLDVSNA